MCAALARFEFQLGVRNFWPIANRGAVSESSDENEDICGLNGFAADLCRLFVLCGKVRHVRDRIAGFRHR
jgi:hypothetical protein